jgi:hypothetical protein
MTQITAEIAYDRYRYAYNHDALAQGAWHDTASDGRVLACALGVIDPTVNSALDCPAAVMPRWLAQHVVRFFDGQTERDAKSWGLSFYAELARIGGIVPFSVVHDWQATVVGPLNVEIAERLKLDPALPAAVRDLHIQARDGTTICREQWFDVLKPSLQQVYRKLYANAYADADADAYAYA